MRFGYEFDPDIFAVIPTFAFYWGDGFSIQFCWAFWLGELIICGRED